MRKIIITICSPKILILGLVSLYYIGFSEEHEKTTYDLLMEKYRVEDQLKQERVEIEKEAEKKLGPEPEMEDDVWEYKEALAVYELEFLKYTKISPQNGRILKPENSDFDRELYEGWVRIFEAKIDNLKRERDVALRKAKKDLKAEKIRSLDPIGLTEGEYLKGYGEPSDRSVSKNIYGVRKTLIYSNDGSTTYVFIEDGIVTSVSKNSY